MNERVERIREMVAQEKGLLQRSINMEMTSLGTDPEALRKTVFNLQSTINGLGVPVDNAVINKLLKRTK